MDRPIRSKVTAIQGFAGDRANTGQRALPELAKRVARELDRMDVVVCRTSMEDVAALPDVLEASRANFEEAARIVVEGLNETTPSILLTARCATAIATIPQVLLRYPDATVLWFDAHGDLNTPETSETGYLGGMPLAAALGLWDSGYGQGLNVDQLCLIGVRALDPAEQQLIDRNGIFLLNDLSSKEQHERLASLIRGRPIYVHLDLDVLEPGLVETEYSVTSGLEVGDVQEIISTAKRLGHLLGIEISEFNSTEDSHISAAAKAIARMLKDACPPA